MGGGSLQDEQFIPAPRVYDLRFLTFHRSSCLDKSAGLEVKQVYRPLEPIEQTYNQLNHHV